ncbi:hypothetical protein QJQ45_017725, partial [Haematococcus lacustris]
NGNLVIEADKDVIDNIDVSGCACLSARLPSRLPITLECCCASSGVQNSGSGNLVVGPGFRNMQFTLNSTGLGNTYVFGMTISTPVNVFSKGLKPKTVPSAVFAGVHCSSTTVLLNGYMEWRQAEGGAPAAAVPLLPHPRLPSPGLVEAQRVEEVAATAADAPAVGQSEAAEEGGPALGEGVSAAGSPLTPVDATARLPLPVGRLRCSDPRPLNVL